MSVVLSPPTAARARRPAPLARRAVPVPPAVPSIVLIPPAVTTPDAVVGPMLPAVIAHPEALLLRLAALAPGDSHRVAVRAAAIQWYLPMANDMARRYAGRGEPLDDLVQVAVVGLIKAVDRFDASRGVPFNSYAIPTVLGEIKRHFRDVTWSVRVPRRLQELRPRLATATEELSQLLRRSPTPAELATELGISRQELLFTHNGGSAYRPTSLDQPVGGTEDLHLVDVLESGEPGTEAVDNRETLRVLLAGLPGRERRIIGLHFYAGMTQSQIAAEIGISQMHVSRLLARSLARLQVTALSSSSAEALTDPAKLH